MQKYRYIQGKEMPMILSEEILLILAVLTVFAVMFLSSLRKRKESQFRDGVRKLELVLQPRETIKVICPQKKGRVILTSKRVLFETKDGFHAVTIKTIKRVQGNNEKGNRTTVPAKMVSLTIKADQDYEIKNSCPEFQEFTKQLIKKTAPKKTKKQGKK